MKKCFATWCLQQKPGWEENSTNVVQMFKCSAWKCCFKNLCLGFAVYTVQRDWVKS